MTTDLLVRCLGPRGAVLHGDPCVYGRWRWVRRHLQTGAVRTLDAGSGSGAFALYAASLGNEVVGVSFDQRNNAVARRRADVVGLSNVRFIDADLTELKDVSSRLGAFDQVLCLEVIEHIREDGRLLSDLARLLRPGGRVLLTTPFAGYRRMIGDALDHGGRGGHVRWGYTHDEMRVLMRAAGLEPIAEEFVNGAVSQQLTNLMRLGDRVQRHGGWMLTLPLRPLAVLDPWATSLLRYPPLNIAVVATTRG